MDEDMSFPNPVERHDLPVKKSRWPKVIAGLLVFGVLAVAFLPQILHTRIGRRLLRAKLEGKYAGEVLLDDFHTSWFGGTSAHQFWIKGSDGRVVGFAGFQSDKLSLLKLIRGKYDLGHCTIDGLVVEYVLDNGEAGHNDTYERLTGTPSRAPGSPPAVLAKLSGQITLNAGRLSLSRAELDAKTLQPVAQTVTFLNLSGTFAIPSLDQPWKFDLEGDEGLKAKGTLCLGRGGLLTGADVTADATASIDHVPSDLVAVLLPQVSVDDCHTGFGPMLEQASVVLNGSKGLLTMRAKAQGARGKFDLSPTFDLKSQPAGMTVDGSHENVITSALPRGLAGRQLVIANPLLADAIEGNFTLRVTALDAPFARAWPAGSGKATLDVKDLKTPPRPAPIARQLAAVSGAESFSRDLRCGPESLSFDRGVVTVAPTNITLGDVKATLSGTATVDGKLSENLAIASPALAAALGHPAVNIPLSGTAAEPMLDIDAAGQSAPESSAKLHEWVAARTSYLRRREVEAMQNEKDRQMEESIKPLAGP
jgi:hypothetical protein